MTSKHKDPFKTISFNNLDLEKRPNVKIIKEQEMEDGFKFVRYLVEANLIFSLLWKTTFRLTTCIHFICAY